MITTPLLQQLYPALIQHKVQYGNPNIPLGSTEGRQCNQLRRMHIQGKLTEVETNLLTDMGFIFHTLEDVYEHADFDDMMSRLLQYKSDNNGNLDIPKKYPPDPELGAWVTGIRRLGKEGVSTDHRDRLDAVGFQWISSRKCGSKFMAEYRQLQERLLKQEPKEDVNVVWKDPSVQKFIRAQKEAYKRQTISETRIGYLTELFGDEWWNKEL